MLLKIRITSFLTGFAVASALGLYQLRQDVLHSHEVLAAQVGAATRVACMHDHHMP